MPDLNLPIQVSASPSHIFPPQANKILTLGLAQGRLHDTLKDDVYKVFQYFWQRSLRASAYASTSARP